MHNLNTVTILGRLTRDPELRHAAGGIAVASFSIAANRPYQDRGGQWKDEVAYVPCVAFGRNADQLAAKQKGEPVLATGRLRTEAWQKEGASHSRLVLIAETLHFVINTPKTSSTAQTKEVLPEPTEIQKAVPF